MPISIGEFENVKTFLYSVRNNIITLETPYCFSISILKIIVEKVSKNGMIKTKLLFCNNLIF